jgi:hypothetical protein
MITGTRMSGSLSPGYFRLLKEEEAKRSLVGMPAISEDTLQQATAKGLGEIYAERHAGKAASRDYRWGNMQYDIARRKLELEEEAEEDRQKGEMWAGIGTIAGTAAGFLPVIGPAISKGIALGTKALTSTQPTSSVWTQPSYDEYYGGYSGPQQGVESTWPSESRFLKMGGDLLWGSGGK